jgi:cystathionine beta-synthase
MIERGHMKSHGRSYTVGELIRHRRDSGGVISVNPSQKAEEAIALFRRHEISQLPVMEDGRVVGCILELTLARLLHSRTDPRQVAIRDIMARPMPTVDEHVDLDEVYRLLSSGNSGVVVLRGDQPIGVVTRIDLVNFWDDPFQGAASPESRADRAPSAHAGAKASR